MHLGVAFVLVAVVCLGVGFVIGRITTPDPLKTLAAEGAKRIAAPIVRAMDDSARCNTEIERLAGEVNACAAQLGAQIKAADRAKRDADQHARDALDMAEKMQGARDALEATEPGYRAWAEQPLPTELQCVRAREDCARGGDANDCAAAESYCGDSTATDVQTNND